jgi:WhiB family redox-sensing transcriptional regulator
MTKKIIGALPRWKLRACGDMDPELFFADDLVTFAHPVVQAACNRCVISTACLAWAMENNEQFGVWGGTTPKQRRALKRPIIRLRCPGCSSEAILEEPTSETCLSCGLSWKI